MRDNATQTSCDEKLIASYIDGELEPESKLAVEQHLANCDSCRRLLRAHQIFVCELDAVLTHSNVDMPVDFSRQIAARATSDMRGIRSASENKKAAAFCAVLALMSIALLSNASRLTVFSAASQIAHAAVSIGTVVLTAFYDAVASLTVISRVLSRKLILESKSSGLLLGLFALAILLLSRMIASYHRTRATE